MVAPSDSGILEKHFLPPQYERENKVGTLAEIQNPKLGDSITSACGTIKVTVKDDGSLPVSVPPVEYVAAFVVLAGFAQPAAEEIYFRGILFAGLARKFGNIPSIAVVTVLLCVAHPQHWFTVLPAAVLLGAMRLYTGSVKACFACHAAYNLSLVLFMLPISN
jgi:membrane protease YdiL (CAAX protease family)